jgi:protein-S-isoprenylcysteine O-methyltransferase Ste14
MNTESTFQIVFWLLIAAIFIMRGYFAWNVRKAGERLMPDKAAVEREGKGAFAARTLLFLVLLGILVSYGLGLSWIKALSIPFPAWLRWLGAALGLVSLGMWTWAQVALDKQWSAQLQLRQEHHLITSGPYSRVRHPLYSAMQGWATSLALLTANWVFVIFAALTLVGLFARAPREEQMMLDQFGDEYREYMRKTGRFWPK